MSESDVLRAAADVLQRKIECLVNGGIGKEITAGAIHAIMTVGSMTLAVAMLQDLADSFETKEGDE